MYQPPRGTRDFLPDEMYKRNWVLERICEVYEAYGFEPLGTPAFESWELLKMKSGEDVVNQIYYFKDKADRELGLRFDLTTSLARVVATHRELQMPFKRYATGAVWRYENPSEKRFREFWQADADTVGVSDVIADAEVLSAAVDCLKKMGFEGFWIQLNDRRILEEFILRAGVPMERVLEAIRAVDKLLKIGREGVIEELRRLSIGQDEADKLLDALSLTGEPEHVLTQAEKRLKDSSEGLKGCKALRDMITYAKSFGYAEYIVVELSLARGLDYYTGPVFEVSAKGYEDYGSIAGGGRYDEIINIFGGNTTPATGISFGIERLVPLLEMKGGFDKIALGVDVLVAPVSESVKGEAIKVAQELRSAGHSTILDLMGRRFSKQLEYADKKHVRKVVIVGERELAEGSLAIRDMETGEQTKIERGKLLDCI
ncbi:TPA: histidine--tRNA ligase [Candidatus Bathyarchaeota archaeon]|nr:histidine--tRNA ligase [Candidatus Bathyarchaeota archaeon]